MRKTPEEVPADRSQVAGRFPPASFFAVVFGVPALVLSVMVAAAFWLVFPAEQDVPDEAVDAVVGSAQVVHEIRTSNSAGRVQREIRILVLDFGPVTAEEAINSTEERLRGNGWTGDHVDGTHLTMRSDNHRVILFMEPLQAYLATNSDDAVRVGAQVAELRRAFPAPGDLVVAHVENDE